uniref:hypothetical protein n=1 Tax=Geminicoccus flavidas TaxID=2506407 RepID=UPI0013582233
MRVLILIVCLLLASPALAAPSPVGIWRLDEASLDQALDRLIEGLLQAVPEEERDEARASMVGQRDAMRDEMASSLAATFEFRPDGKVVITDPDEDEPEQGSWRMEGDRLHVVDDDPDTPDLTGEVQEDRITLGFEVDRDDPD